MTRFFFLLAIIIMGTSARGQNILDRNWKFNTGDSAAWAIPAFDDSGWQTIRAGELWEKQGFQGYDGMAWYRKKVFIPADLKAEALKHGGMQLSLARIDDADEVFLNGEKIAEHGSLPPNYEGAYDVDRVMTLPIDKVLWGKDNCIAVRVYDAAGNGGIYGEAIDLRPVGAADLIDLRPEFKREDHIFVNLKAVVLPITVSSKLKKATKATVTTVITSDFGNEIMQQEDNITIPAKGQTNFQMVAEDLPAGFYSCHITLSGADCNKSIRFSFGKDPEKIVSPLNRPADFEEYWARAKQELSCIDPQFRMIRIDSLSTATREAFLVEMRSLGNVLIRGWYARPVKPGKYPAILHVQGYSTTQELSWGYPGDDMVVFVLNIRGHGNSKDNVNPGFPGYLQYQLHDKEQYIYRGAYMDCLRAVDFLYAQPQVDTSRVAVAGGSQGGALSFATAALDNQRIALCLPHVPFLSDFEDYFKTATWPAGEFVNYVAETPGATWKKVFETLSYIDIKNLAPWIRCPMHMAVGLVDDVCPPHINFAAYNQVVTPKSYVLYPYNGHGLPSVYHDLKYEVLRKQFGMK